GTLLDADANGITREMDVLGFHEKGIRAGHAVALSSLVAGANHDIDTPYTELVRITGPNSAFSVGGFQHWEDGRVVRLLYTGTNVMTIRNEDTSSTAANRIKTLTGANVALGTGGPSVAVLLYDSSLSRWVLVSHNP